MAHSIDRVLHRAAVGIAIASTLLGAAVSVLPAVVIGIVHLFYNSAGGVLILLGSLVDLMPRAASSGGGSSSLPAFQILKADTGIIVLRSAVGTVLSAVAAMLIAAPGRPRDGGLWLRAGLCCGLAAIAGGRVAALALAPGIAVSTFYLVLRPPHPLT